MEAWRKVWREGVLPLLTKENLEVLLAALESDDQTLIQGATSQPPPLQCVADWPVEACCAFGYMGWKQGLETVGEIETFFATMAYEVDCKIDEPAGCRFFLNWFDETPRDEMRRELSAEIRRNLSSLPGVGGDDDGDREGSLRQNHLQAG